MWESESSHVLHWFGIAIKGGKISIFFVSEANIKEQRWLQLEWTLTQIGTNASLNVLQAMILLMYAATVTIMSLTFSIYVTFPMKQ